MEWRSSIVLASSVSVLIACGGSQAPPAASAAPEKTIWSDAPAYASLPVPASAAAAHAAKKVTTEGKPVACGTCHKAGGTASPFTFSGTIYADKEATKGASDVEIRFVDGAGVAVSVHTDADGSFWSKGPALSGSAHAGARNAAKTKLMQQPVTNGDCNGCHASDMPMLLVVP